VNKTELFNNEIGELLPESTHHFLSNKWSLHQLFSWILSQIGPSKVYLSTYSISEVAIRTFMYEVDKGNILELNCLFDYSIKKNKLHLLMFANNITSEIRLINNHSKIILFENDNMNLVVNTSANFNTNLRIEAGVISTKKAIYEQYLEVFLKFYNESIPLEFDKYED